MKLIPAHLVDTSEHAGHDKHSSHEEHHTGHTQHTRVLTPQPTSTSMRMASSGKTTWSR